MSTRVLIVAVLLSAATAWGVVHSPPAEAATYSVSGTVTCKGGNTVVGVWVQSTGKGSGWAKVTRDSVFPHHATISRTLSAKGTVRLDVGCGGSGSKWKTNNSTPNFSVTGTKKVSVGCSEKTGSRAVRCTMQPLPVSSTVLTRAKSWVDARVPYSQSKYYKNKYGSYRQDCSGFVSMAWGLSTSYNTVTLPQVSVKISKADLRPGDVLLNTAPGNGGHVAIFVRWADSKKTKYVAYEANGAVGRTWETTIPYPYWSGNGTFAPYRKK